MLLLNDAVEYYRRQMEECWIELETASDWEHVSQISKRLNSAGLLYKHYKAIRHKS
jgi:hypothetical protein